MQSASTDLIVLQRFRAIFHQGIRPHVVVRTNHQSPERVHQGVVSIATITGTKEVLHQWLQTLITQARVDLRKEFFFFAGAYIEQIGVGLQLFQVAEVLLYIGRGRVVEDDHLWRMTVLPKMFVVFVNCFAYIAQSMRRNYKASLWGVHNIGGLSGGMSSAGNADLQPYERYRQLNGISWARRNITLFIVERRA